MIRRIALSALAMLMAAGSFAQNEWKEIELTNQERTMVKQNNDFAFNLFRQVTMKYGFIGHGGCMPPEGFDTSAPYKSQIISPLSITYALGMLNNGAAGKTQQEINQVLGFGDTGADAINAFCRKMLTEASTLDELTKVNIANTIFFNQSLGYQPKESFVEKANTYYDAELQLRNFYDGETLDVINQWASDHTEGMIQNILDEQTFKPDALSYLLNALYFNGVWTLKFDPEETREETFQLETSTLSCPVQMMHLEKELPYTENGDYQAVCLPYGNTSYMMTILLPREGKTVEDLLWELEADSKNPGHSLTSNQWEELRWMGNAIVDVKLPRFEVETDVDLKTIMTLLGMPTAFDSKKAEFPDICENGGRFFIHLMKQKAKIKVSEEGTEAAAVTIIGVMPSSMGPTETPHKEFHANRPFLYIISERSTSAIFFIGQYMGEVTDALQTPHRRQATSADDYIYNLQGQRHHSPVKGLNIIRHSDGTTKKMIMR